MPGTSINSGVLAAFQGNAEIQKVMQHQRDKIFRVTLQISLQNPTRMQTSLAEHILIFEKIRGGDPKKAAALVQAHFDRGKRYLLNF